MDLLSERRVGINSIKRDKTRLRTREIMKSAERLFCEKGFDGTSISEIALAANVAEGTIYLHFKSKREILHAVLVEFHLDLTRKLEAELSAIDDYSEKIKHTIRFQFQSMRNNPGISNLFLNDVRAQGDYFNSPVLLAARHYTNVMVDLVEQGVKKGVFDPAFPPRLIRYIVYGTIEHLALRFLHSSGIIEIDQITEDFAKAVFAALGVKPAARSLAGDVDLLQRFEAVMDRLETYSQATAPLARRKNIKPKRKSIQKRRPVAAR